MDSIGKEFSSEVILTNDKPSLISVGSSKRGWTSVFKSELMTMALEVSWSL